MKPTLSVGGAHSPANCSPLAAANQRRKFVPRKTHKHIVEAYTRRLPRARDTHAQSTEVTKVQRSSYEVR